MLHAAAPLIATEKATYCFARRARNAWFSAAFLTASRASIKGASRLHGNWDNAKSR
jgi:hypothetical protein